ncbi:MAG: ATP-dependent DNA ligase [Myxococcota bacterium]
MAFPLAPPIPPMLSRAARDIPLGEWLYEPKWDGFRALVFRDGDTIHLQSRDEKPLERYFPELLPALRANLPRRCVLDGEIVIARPDGLDFEALLQRIHPAASRVEKLSRETPASMVFWDLLALDDEDLTGVPFVERRRRLEGVLAGARPPIHLTPATRDAAVAADWFTRFEGAGLDGIVAKGLAEPYRPGERVMVKVKHERTADCVVGGFRWHKEGPGTMVGSLLLGLYNARGALQHVGIAAAFTRKKREELVGILAPYRVCLDEPHPWRGEFAGSDPHPGATSRWNAGKDLSFEPLRPALVVEVAYDHLQGTRFRHATQFRRWRPDKRPTDCTYAQLEETPPYELTSIFSRTLVAPS